MGETPEYQLPWPEMNDPANVPTYLQNLAVATEGGLQQAVGAHWPEWDGNKLTTDEMESKRRPWISLTHPDFGVNGDGNPEALAINNAMEWVRTNGYNMWVPPGCTFNVDGMLSNWDDNMNIAGFQIFGNTGDANPDGGSKFRFTGTAPACIRSYDLASPLLHASISGIGMRVSGDYDQVIDIRNAIDLKFVNTRMEVATDLACGGIRSQRLSAGQSTWVIYLFGTFVRLPDMSTGRAMDIDMSDGQIVGGAFTGGAGTALRGSGGITVLGTRFDNAEIPLMLSNETESRMIFQVVGANIQNARQYGILLDGDALNPWTGLEPTQTWVQPGIVGCQFWNSGASGADIYFKNDVGIPLQGGLVDGSTHSVAGTLDLRVDRTRWAVKIGNADAMRTSLSPEHFGYASPFDRSFTLARRTSTLASPIQTITGVGTEGTLATIPLPRRSLGPNGWMRVTMLCSRTGSDPVTLRGKLGNSIFMAPVESSGNQFFRVTRELFNANSEAAQFGGPLNWDGYSPTPAAPIALTAATTNDLNITLTGQLANTADSVSLIGYLIEVFPG